MKWLRAGALGRLRGAGKLSHGGEAEAPGRRAEGSDVRGAARGGRQSPRRRGDTARYAAGTAERRPEWGRGLDPGKALDGELPCSCLVGYPGATEVASRVSSPRFPHRGPLTGCSHCGPLPGSSLRSSHRGPLTGFSHCGPLSGSSHRGALTGPLTAVLSPPSPYRVFSPRSPQWDPPRITSLVPLPTSPHHVPSSAPLTISLHWAPPPPHPFTGSPPCLSSLCPLSAYLHWDPPQSSHGVTLPYLLTGSIAPSCPLPQMYVVGFLSPSGLLCEVSAN